MRLTITGMAIASIFSLGLGLSAAPARAGDVTFHERAETALMSDNRSDDSWIVNVAFDRGTAVSGIASVQAIQDGDVNFRDHADLFAFSKYNGNVVDVAIGEGSLAVTGIASIQAMGTSRR